MAANGISTLSTKQLRQVAKLDLAQLKRKGYTLYADGTTNFGSAQFSGSNYLTVAGSAGTAMGTGDFTWEAWVYPTSSSGYQAFIDTRTNPLGGGDTTGFYFGTNTDTLAPIYYTNGPQLVSSVNLTLNAWNHVALVRTSGTVTLWVNGASGGDNVDSTNLTEQRVFIGSGGMGLYLTGNISNLRIVKSTALYTSAFTPSLSPFTAVTGTQLLLNTADGANFLKDSSTNNFTVTNTGSVVTSSSGPGPDTVANFYRSRNVYDIDSLADKYTSNTTTVMTTSTLVEGRPWATVYTGLIFNYGDATISFSLSGRTFSNVTCPYGAGGYPYGEGVDPVLLMPGNQLAGGTSPANDIYWEYTAVDGVITGFTYRSGTPP